MEEINSSKFYVKQNTPNPYKEKTQIQYHLSEKSKVKLTIYSSKNKKVKRVINKIQQPGNYSIHLEAEQFFENCYYYEMKITKLPLGVRVLYNDIKRMWHIK